MNTSVRLVLVLISAFCLITSVYGAENSYTNINHTFNHQFDKYEPKSLFGSRNTAVKIFEKEMTRSATRSYVDRFGPQTQIYWIRERNQNGYKSIERINSSGRSIFERAFENGMRDTAADLFPQFTQYQDWAEDIFTGAVGNTSEKEMDLTSISPGAHEQSWWRKLRQSDAFTYGVRIEDSYVYASGIFRDSEGKTLALGSIRCKYDIIKNTPMVMAQTIIPVGSTEISAGVNFNPYNTSSQNSMLEYSFRWEKIFGNGMLGRNTFIGGRNDAENRWMLLCGYSKKF